MRNELLSTHELNPSKPSMWSRAPSRSFLPRRKAFVRVLLLASCLAGWNGVQPVAAVSRRKARAAAAEAKVAKPESKTHAEPDVPSKGQLVGVDCRKEKTLAPLLKTGDEHFRARGQQGGPCCTYKWIILVVSFPSDNKKRKRKKALMSFTPLVLSLMSL
jgi:hypothetical protein